MRSVATKRLHKAPYRYATKRELSRRDEDGKKIIFADNSPTTGVNIYTVNADGSGLFQVTHDGGDDDPAWGTHPPVGSAEPTADHTLREPNGRSQRPWPC